MCKCCLINNFNINEYNDEKIKIYLNRWSIKSF
jgi:hypothetical protein